MKAANRPATPGKDPRPAAIRAVVHSTELLGTAALALGILVAVGGMSCAPEQVARVDASVSSPSSDANGTPSGGTGGASSSSTNPGTGGVPATSHDAGAGKLDLGGGKAGADGGAGKGSDAGAAGKGGGDAGADRGGSGGKTGTNLPEAGVQSDRPGFIVPDAGGGIKLDTGGGGGPTVEPCTPKATLTAATGSINTGAFEKQGDTPGEYCFRTPDVITQWGCSSMDGRALKVNGKAVTCTSGTGSMPLPPAYCGYYYFEATITGTGTPVTWASLWLSVNGTNPAGTDPSCTSSSPSVGGPGSSDTPDASTADPSASH